MSNIQANLPMEEIRAFCQKWKVKELSLFGSILRDDFQPDSDVDVLVNFAEGGGITFHNYPRMRDELQAIFGHEVDLVERESVETSPNYIRRRDILGSAERLYEA